MRWLPFIILACIGIVLQTTVIYRVELSHGSPDLMFIIAVHYALHAVSPDAMIAAWVLGFLTDLYGPGRLGVFAFGFGLMAIVIVQLRDSMFRDHPLTWMFVTFIGAWLVHFMAGVHFIWVAYPHSGRTIIDVVLCATFTAIYTVVPAPYIHWLFGRFRGLLGLLPAHRLRTRRMI
ncbi:MAG: rod shape-determining protein MreD [Phycisphaerae bacterium]|nr:rod shape-determining protein MreD [Phycisphaerae bacterium]